MPYFLRDASKDDIPAMADLATTARDMTKPPTERDDFYRSTQSALTNDFGNQKKDFLVVVCTNDGQNKIVGMADWISPGSSAHEDGVEQETQLVHSCLGEKATQMYSLNSVIADPDYKRKGVSGMLLDWGLDKAQAEGKGVYLFVGDLEVDTFEDMQFEELDSVTVLGAERHLMIWEPSDLSSACDVGGKKDEIDEDDSEPELGALGMG